MTTASPPTEPRARGSVPRFDVRSTLRTIANEDSATDWRDYRNLQADYRASAQIPGGFVAAEFSIEHDEQRGAALLYGECATAEGGALPIRFKWYEDGAGSELSREPGAALAPADLPVLAMMLHRLGDAVTELAREVDASLPEMRQRALEFRDAFDGYVKAGRTDGPRYDDAAWSIAHDLGIDSGGVSDVTDE